MTEEKLKQQLSALLDTELINKCRKEISTLARTYGNSHRMSIPPSSEDTDMLLSEIVDRFEMYLILDKFPE